jgi:23S rRNA (pseudouridine1915-N3)-methyltransferase
MLIEIVCVCRRPPAWVSTMTSDYAKRLARHLALQLRYVAPGPESATREVRRRDEASRVEKILRPGSLVVALDCGGDPLSSMDLATRLDIWRQSQSAVTLLIGGADGLDPDLMARASQRWSLSNLTLPHLLVQIIVTEQIYRAWSILEGHPYHRA